MDLTQGSIEAESESTKEQGFIEKDSSNSKTARKSWFVYATMDSVQEGEMEWILTNRQSAI